MASEHDAPTHRETYFEQLRTLRDRIRLELNLAGKDLRDEWRDLERRFPEASVTMAELAAATSAALHKPTQELRAFLARLVQQRRANGTCVDAYMTVPPITCRADERLHAITGRMWDADIGCLPVLDDQHRVVGMITDRDACMASYTQGKALADISVASAMAHKVLTSRVGDAVESVLELMKDNQIRRVPVLDARDELVGMVALNDLARAAAERKHKGLDKAAVADTLAAVCTPRRSRTDAQHTVVA